MLSAPNLDYIVYNSIRNSVKLFVENTMIMIQLHLLRCYRLICPLCVYVDQQQQVKSGLVNITAFFNSNQTTSIAIDAHIRTKNTYTMNW